LAEVYDALHQHANRKRVSPSPSTFSSLSSTLVPTFWLYCGRESSFLATDTCFLSTGAVASLLHFDCT
jgi:hypothetical protein